MRFETELRATLTEQQKVLLEQFEKAALRSLEKADVIPIHMEHEQGELESEEQNTRDVRMEQFKAIIGSILTEALKENNVELHEKVVKEMDYLFRVNDEAAEERYKKLDETIRSCQRSGKEAAAGKDTRFKHRKKIKKLT